MNIEPHQPVPRHVHRAVGHSNALDGHHAPLVGAPLRFIDEGHPTHVGHPVAGRIPARECFDKVIDPSELLNKWRFLPVRSSDGSPSAVLAKTLDRGEELVGFSPSGLLGREDRLRIVESD